jgi:predicted sugar kinase
MEPGRLSDEAIAPLDKRVPIPGVWRFVLIAPRRVRGLSGNTEKDAFAQLPPVPHETTKRLVDLARDVIIPAADTGHFEQFAEATYDFGYLAGRCFAKVQGSAFAGQRLTSLVNNLREMGVRGVGQSSWGPTVFAVLPDSSAARWLTDRLGRQYAREEFRVVTTSPNNSGARIETI